MLGPFGALQFKFVVEVGIAEVSGEALAAEFERVLVDLVDLVDPAPPEAGVATLSVERTGRGRGRAWCLRVREGREGSAARTAFAAADDAYVVSQVLREINSSAIRTVDCEVVLHGAALSHEGSAIVVAGASHAGKSTLAAALTLAGWRYLSDDVAPVRVGPSGDFVVLRYPKPIMLRPASMARFAGCLPAASPSAAEFVRYERPEPASSFGRVGADTRLGAIVILDALGANPLSPGAAVLELARACHAKTDEVGMSRSQLAQLGAIATAIPVVAMIRPDLSTAASAAAASDRLASIVHSRR